MSATLHVQTDRGPAGRRPWRRVAMAGGLVVAMILAAAAGYYTGDPHGLPEAPLGDSKGGPPSGPAPSVMVASADGAGLSGLLPARAA